jgi:BMFP domain-containing protein YqiC
MMKDNKFFDDMAKMASGAAGSLLEMRREMEALIASKIERMLAGHHFVTREEFDAVKEMAAKARAEQEVLSKKLADLEKKL